MLSDLPDVRALGAADVPYSAYCKVCWCAVWRLYTDTPTGTCIHEHKSALDCEEARNHAQNAAVFAKAKGARPC